jgi:hypothetical protein
MVTVQRATTVDIGTRNDMVVKIHSYHSDKILNCDELQMVLTVASVI